MSTNEYQSIKKRARPGQPEQASKDSAYDCCESLLAAAPLLEFAQHLGAGFRHVAAGFGAWERCPAPVHHEGVLFPGVDRLKLGEGLLDTGCLFELLGADWRQDFHNGIACGLVLRLRGLALELPSAPAEAGDERDDATGCCTLEQPGQLFALKHRGQFHRLSFLGFGRGRRVPSSLPTLLLVGIIDSNVFIFRYSAMYENILLWQKGTGYARK